MNKDEFIKETQKLGITITDEIMKKLDVYYELLTKYNKHTNLTRITDKNDVYLKHFYDSLTLVKSINLDNQKLLDIGTGAGFPGLVLKIVFPNLKVTLLDSLKKRIVFLEDVIHKLKLTDIKVVHERAEEYINNNREKYDIVTSRAVANLRILSELCIPYITVNGYFIAMKSEIEEELKNAKNAIDTLGTVIKETISFKLPISEDKRTLIVIKKIKQTDKKYPRKFGEIKKKPL